MYHGMQNVIREHSVRASQSKHVADQPFWVIQSEEKEKEARWQSGEVSRPVMFTTLVGWYIVTEIIAINNIIVILGAFYATDIKYTL